jgi:hypothetical protein
MPRTRILMLVSAAALAVTIGAGAAAAPQTGAAAKPSPKPASTGIPECDTYFAKVDACIATKKMTTEEQQATEFTVNRLRAMVPIARSAEGKKTLVDRCTQSLELAQKDDKYGCYKSEDKARVR